MADDTTTIQVNGILRFLQQEGRYTENMAMIVEASWRTARTAGQRIWQQQEGYPVVA